MVKLDGSLWPLSGYEAKLDEPIKRYHTTVFGYGCQLGPSQTARSVDGVDRCQLSWINQHHIDEDKLEQALMKVINGYHQFALPKTWGSGKSASADGTK